MAIKIVEEKPHKSVVKRVVCLNCGVTLEYVPNDVKVHIYKDISGTSDSYNYIDCPKCSKRIVVK